MHSVEKANVMESGVFWREIVTDLHKSYTDVEIEHMYADNCAMQLVRNPKQFDVIVTDNLFGDILSDCAAMLTARSVCCRRRRSVRRMSRTPQSALRAGAWQCARYRRRRQSQSVRLPPQLFHDAAVFLRTRRRADLVDQAVANVLRSDVRTPDIMGDVTAVSTEAMGDSLLQELDRLSA